MICPNCNKETNRQIYEKFEEGGVIKTLIYCQLCPRAESNLVNFPAIVTGKRGRGRPRKVDNSPEVLTNAPNVQRPAGLVDTPTKRERDNIANQDKRKSVIVMGDIKKEKMQMFVKKQLDSQFGGAPHRIIQNDGVTITAERSA